MKHVLMVTLLLAALVGCTDKPTLSMDPNAQIVLNGVEALPSLAPSSKVVPPKAPYSLDTIVRYAQIWSYNSKSIPSGLSEMGISPDSRDLTAKRLLIGYPSDAVRIDKNGNPQLGWIVGDSIFNVVLGVKHLQSKPGHWVDVLNPSSDYTQEKDTIGYIPNRVIREAERQIKIAFDKGDYDECLRLFKEAYVFIPITGPEWRALKAENKQ